MHEKVGFFRVCRILFKQEIQQPDDEISMVWFHQPFYDQAYVNRNIPLEKQLSVIIRDLQEFLSDDEQPRLVGEVFKRQNLF